MKKCFLMLLTTMLCCTIARAVPAYPGTVCMSQPDGTSLTVRLHGDEYRHFNTTADGYSVVRRADGFYVYAQLGDDGQLEATDRIAHDVEARTADELMWLEQIQKMQAPQMSAANVLRQQADFEGRAKARAAAANHAQLYDYDNFRGLVLLVEYNDRPFSRNNIAEIINGMVNQENYPGYSSSGLGKFTGSVRDYFADNSDSIFVPQFDVVGPVAIDCSQYDPNGTENAYIVTTAAIEAADSLVDFSQYDIDQDGVVDMVFFIFSGLGSNYGNDSRLLWPHQSEVYKPGGQWGWQYVYKDGVRLGRYACSTELAGYQGGTSSAYLDGIGTICHEFSHVLGLPDFYDTDYEGSGGESAHPGDWSVMSGGSYLNYARTPCGYTLYERYALGFTTPQVLDQEGSYELPAIGVSNMGYRLNTPVKKEFFLIENRQKTSKWDKYLPGHGMLVFRTDSTNAQAWRSNNININPNHMYFELLRAKKNNSSTAKSSDPFPGTGRVTVLNNMTSPANLLTYAGKPTPFGFENISESNGVITFDIVDVNVLKEISLPQTMTLGEGLSAKLVETRVPDYAPYTLVWSSDNESVVSVDEDGIITAVSQGEAVITVVANDNEALTAHCTVIVEELPLVPSIADFKSQDTGTEAALKLDNALVVFANDENIFVRDASGALLLANTGLQLETGDMLNGMVYGKFGVVNNVPQLQPVEVTTNSRGFVVTKDNEVTPREVTWETISDEDRADLITIVDTKLERKSVSGKTGVWAVDGDRQIRLYNSYQIQGISLPKTIGSEHYDVIGLYITNKLGGNLIDEIQMTQSPVVHPEENGIASLDVKDHHANISIYTTDGRLVNTTTMQNLSQLRLPHGIYVIKSDSKIWKIQK